MANNKTMDNNKKKKLLYIAGVIALVLILFFFGDKLTPIFDALNSGLASSDTGKPVADSTSANLPDSTSAGTTAGTTPGTSADTGSTGLKVEKDGKYTSKEEVALYIHTFGCLPSNYITKAQAREKGWPDGGPVEKYAPGFCIGGDKFGNNEGLLPKKSGRQYYECDIDAPLNASRNAKRIVFSNAGLIYYTEDHYQSYELLYGTP